LGDKAELSPSEDFFPTHSLFAKQNDQFSVTVSLFFTLPEFSYDCGGGNEINERSPGVGIPCLWKVDRPFQVSTNAGRLW